MSCTIVCTPFYFYNNLLIITIKFFKKVYVLKFYNKDKEIQIGQILFLYVEFIVTFMPKFYEMSFVSISYYYNLTFQ